MKVDKSKWEHKRMSDCITTVKVQDAIQKKNYQQEGKYPIISQEKDFISGYCDSDENLNSIGNVVIFGDHTRVIKYIDFDFCVGADGVKVIRPNADICTKYLYYMLRWADIPNNGYSRHFKYLKELTISYPTMSAQQSIVSELDAIQAMIDGYKAQIADLDVLAQSIFLEMFGDPVENPKGWETFLLKDLTNKMSTGPFGSMLHKEDYDKEGIPAINPQNIKGNKISVESISLVNRNKAQELNRYILHTKDIVIARRGDLSKCAIVTQSENGWLCGTGSFFLSLKDLNPILFWYFYTSKSVQKYLNDKCIGATMPNLNQGILSSLKLPVPPIDLQQHFVTQISAIEKQKELYRVQLHDAETLMAERMQYYFS